MKKHQLKLFEISDVGCRWLGCQWCTYRKYYYLIAKSQNSETRRDGCLQAMAQELINMQQQMNC
jgi:hypothetical protein